MEREGSVAAQVEHVLRAAGAGGTNTVLSLSLAAVRARVDPVDLWSVASGSAWRAPGAGSVRVRALGARRSVRRVRTAEWVASSLSEGVGRSTLPWWSGRWAPVSERAAVSELVANLYGTGSGASAGVGRSAGLAVSGVGGGHGGVARALVATRQADSALLLLDQSHVRWGVAWDREGVLVLVSALWSRLGADAGPRASARAVQSVLALCTASGVLVDESVLVALVQLLGGGRGASAHRMRRAEDWGHRSRFLPISMVAELRFSMALDLVHHWWRTVGPAATSPAARAEPTPAAASGLPEAAPAARAEAKTGPPIATLDARLAELRGLPSGVWDALIELCAHNELLERGMEVAEAASTTDEWRRNPRRNGLEALLHAATLAPAPAVAPEHVLLAMRGAGVAPRDKTVNALIAAALQHPNAAAALPQLLEDLTRSLGLPQLPWGAVGRAAFAAARLGQWDQVRAVLHVAQRLAPASSSSSPRWVRRLAALVYANHQQQQQQQQQPQQARARAASDPRA